jgi:Epoxide hydrolase N terminus
MHKRSIFVIAVVVGLSLHAVPARSQETNESIRPFKVKISAAAEAKLNALPQFTTNIDGLDIHFIHVRSRHPNAMPVIITHGWPGSVLELLEVMAPLTDPTAHGGRAEDAAFKSLRSPD